MTNWYYGKNDVARKPAAKVEEVKRIKNKNMETRVVTLENGNYAVGSRINTQTNNLELIFVRDSHKKPLTDKQIGDKKPSVKLIFPHVEAVDNVGDALYSNVEALEVAVAKKAAAPATKEAAFKLLTPTDAKALLAKLLGVNV